MIFASVQSSPVISLLTLRLAAGHAMWTHAGSSQYSFGTNGGFGPVVLSLRRVVTRVPYRDRSRFGSVSAEVARLHRRGHPRSLRYRYSAHETYIFLVSIHVIRALRVPLGLNIFDHFTPRSQAHVRSHTWTNVVLHSMPGGTLSHAQVGTPRSE